MSQITLEVAKCCGTCIWTNQKKRPTPENHAPHYTIAKTERWCEKFNIPTVREAVCDSWELESKKGGAAAVKRALSQNRRLEAILELKKRLTGGKVIDWNGYRFTVQNDYVIYSWLNSSLRGSWYKMSCKENRFDKFLNLT